MKTLTCKDILILEQILPRGRKGVKVRRVNLNLSRDLLTIKREAEIIRDALENLKSEELSKLENEYKSVYAQIENEARKKNQQISPVALEMEARAGFANFEKMKTLQKEYLKEERKLLNEPCDAKLITTLKEEDIPENCDPETTDALIYFLEE